MKTQLPPGPTAPALYQAYRYAADPGAYLDQCAARYGECFTLRMAAVPPGVFFSSPEAIRDIMTTPVDVARAGEANAPLDFLLGRHSVMRLDGGRHVRERRLMMPPFHGDRLATYADTMRAITLRAMEGWRTGQTLSLLKMAHEVTLDVILECIFGLAPGARQSRVRELFNVFRTTSMTPLMSVLWTTLPGTPLRELLVNKVAPLADALDGVPAIARRLPGAELARCIREIDAFIYEDIEARRAEGSVSRRDVMSMLIAARDEDGREMTPQELRDEMITLLIAGHETSATALAWTLYRMHSEPKVLAAVREELARVVGGGAITAENLRELKYLDATVRETLRLHPPAIMVGRLLAEPTRIGGHDLPAGVIATPAIYLLHRNPRIWPDPLRFDPDRFLDRKPSTAEFIPFGGGPRTCLGMTFALFELKVVLATMLSEATLRGVPGPVPGIRLRGVISGPSRPLEAVVESRHRPAERPN